jgi:hypothetical protein
MINKNASNSKLYENPSLVQVDNIKLSLANQDGDLIESIHNMLSPQQVYPISSKITKDDLYYGSPAIWLKNVRRGTEIQNNNIPINSTLSKNNNLIVFHQLNSPNQYNHGFASYRSLSKRKIIGRNAPRIKDSDFNNIANSKQTSPVMLKMVQEKSSYIPVHISKQGISVHQPQMVYKEKDNTLNIENTGIDLNEYKLLISHRNVNKSQEKKFSNINQASKIISERGMGSYIEEYIVKN